MKNGVVKHDNFKILISSETINFRNILAGKLRLEGFEVEFATGGFHMMHILEKFTDYKMVIINEHMHDMSAQEMIGLVRLTKSKQELPILFISKSNNEEDICDMVFTGANVYIVQSPNFNPILERTHKYLQILKANAA
jgi:DNA-binding response OmpR family regulator